MQAAASWNFFAIVAEYEYLPCNILLNGEGSIVFVIQQMVTVTHISYIKYFLK